MRSIFLILLDLRSYSWDKIYLRNNFIVLKRFNTKHYLKYHVTSCFMFSVFSSNFSFACSRNFIASYTTVALVSNSNLFLTHSLANDKAWTLVLSYVCGFLAISYYFLCNEFKAVIHLSYSNGNFYLYDFWCYI